MKYAIWIFSTRVIVFLFFEFFSFRYDTWKKSLTLLHTFSKDYKYFRQML